MHQSGSVATMSLEEFERYHARLVRKAPPPVSLKEVVVTALIATAVAPFIFATFFLIPLMGQVTVGFAGFVTGLYLFFRRSIVIASTCVGVGVLLSSITFMTIQSIKDRLDVTLFVLIALGIPMTMVYTVFVGMKIWELRGGGE